MPTGEIWRLACLANLLQLAHFVPLHRGPQPLLAGVSPWRSLWSFCFPGGPHICQCDRPHGMWIQPRLSSDTLVTSGWRFYLPYLTVSPWKFMVRVNFSKSRYKALAKSLYHFRLLFWEVWLKLDRASVTSALSQMMGVYLFLSATCKHCLCFLLRARPCFPPMPAPLSDKSLKQTKIILSVFPTRIHIMGKIFVKHSLSITHIL